mmetsp:Transcript_109316/g.233623  ORF Transcript_109316/g.233623 Transcript_109316/m.233623 type:complete len:226 (-) Transcript_109316:2318-2995(-)
MAQGMEVLLAQAEELAVLSRNRADDLLKVEDEGRVTDHLPTPRGVANAAALAVFELDAPLVKDHEAGGRLPRRGQDAALGHLHHLEGNSNFHDEAVRATLPSRGLLDARQEEASGDALPEWVRQSLAHVLCSTGLRHRRSGASRCPDGLAEIIRQLECLQEVFHDAPVCEGLDSGLVTCHDLAGEDAIDVTAGCETNQEQASGPDDLRNAPWEHLPRRAEASDAA